MSITIPNREQMKIEGRHIEDWRGVFAPSAIGHDTQGAFGVNRDGRVVTNEDMTVVRRKILNHSGGGSHVIGGPTINNPLSIWGAAKSKRLGRNRVEELKVDESLSCRGSCNSGGSSDGFGAFLTSVGAVMPVMPFISIVIAFTFDRGRFE